MELSRAEEEGLRGIHVDAYHGDEWRERLQALRHSLPSLYWLAGVQGLPAQGRGAGAPAPLPAGGRSRWTRGRRRRRSGGPTHSALHSNSAPPSRLLNLRPAGSPGEGVSGRTAGVCLSRAAAAGDAEEGKDDGFLGEDEDGEGRTEGEDEEGEGDLLEYMREVRLRELSLAGVRVVKEREREMEERERRKRRGRRSASEPAASPRPSPPPAPTPRRCGQRGRGGPRRGSCGPHVRHPRVPLQAGRGSDSGYRYNRTGQWRLRNAPAAPAGECEYPTCV